MNIEQAGLDRRLKVSQNISEADFSSSVEELLDMFGWLWEHPRPARIKIAGTETYRTAISGHKGRPDYLAVRRGRLLFIELKAEKGKLSPEQEQWFEDLRECQRTITLEPIEKGKALRGNFPMITIPEIYLWKPSQWDELVALLT